MDIVGAEDLENKGQHVSEEVHCKYGLEEHLGLLKVIVDDVLEHYLVLDILVVLLFQEDIDVFEEVEGSVLVLFENILVVLIGIVLSESKQFLLEDVLPQIYNVMAHNVIHSLRILQWLFIDQPLADHIV